MSDARKCDRCGAFYAKGSKGRVVFEYFPNSTSRTKNGGDMCPKCAAKFERWWNAKRKEATE
jgi:hypothetical protein